MREIPYSVTLSFPPHTGHRMCLLFALKAITVAPSTKQERGLIVAANRYPYEYTLQLEDHGVCYQRHKIEILMQYLYRMYVFAKESLTCFYTR